MFPRGEYYMGHVFPNLSESMQVNNSFKVVHQIMLAEGHSKYLFRDF